MNYIKKLQLENAAMDAQITAMQRGVNQLRRHLMSEKFHKDPTIQINDVERMCLDILFSGADANARVMNGENENAA